MSYFLQPNRQSGLPLTPDRLLRCIGASGRLRGFDYAVYMIERVANGQSSVYLITKRLYPETAKYFGVKPNAIEHGLRNLVFHCWNHGDREALWEIAGRRLENAPTNADFIDMLAAYIKNMN